MAVADLTKRIRYYVANESAGTLSVMDGFTNAIVKTYKVGEGPKEVIATGDGAVYVASGANDTVTIIYPEGNTKVLNIPNEGFLAVDIIMGRIYTANRAELQVHDITSGALVVSIPGLKLPEQMILNNSRNRLFILDNNVVNVYSTITLDHINTISLPAKANFIAISDDDSRAYISYGKTPDPAGIVFYDLANSSVITTVANEILTAPAGLTQRNNILYVVNSSIQGTLLSVDTMTYSILPKVIQVGDYPLRVALSPDKSRLYIVNSASGSIDIVDAVTYQGHSVSLGENNKPVAIAGSYLGSVISPGEPIDFSDSYQLDDVKESVCIMAKKVFAHCQQRICFPMVNIPVPAESGKVVLERIIFENGSIVTGTLVVTDLPDRPNFSRVQFALTIPFKAVLRLANGENITVNSVLPEILKDIVMYRPHTRDEFVFETVVETRSETLSTPNITADSITIAVGVFVVIKVIGEVQLLIPAFGYCPEPPECEEYEEPEEEDICQIFLDFNQTPFPEDFFPNSI